MRCVEFGSGILQDVVQSISLVKDGQHCSADDKDETADRLPAPYKGIGLAEATGGLNDDDWRG